MDLFLQLGITSEVAQAVLVLSIISVAGFVLSSIQYKGIGLGITGVLFAGLFFGHIGWHINKEVLEFVREFGLILFVFTIGLQIGPGFFASLRRSGLKLNLCAAAIVIGGALVTVAVCQFFGINPIAGAGLFSGATTNTPSLGAGQQALASLTAVDASQKALPALAYAVAYPGGVFGIILCILLLRIIFGIKPDEELAEFEKERRGQVVPLRRRNIEVANPNLDGLKIDSIPGLHEWNVVISRMKGVTSDMVLVATEDCVVHTGDVLLAIGTDASLDNFQKTVGTLSDLNLMKAPGAILFKRIIVTQKNALGKSLRQLALSTKYDVVVTRVQRGELELTASPDVKLEFGDTLQVVGDQEGLDQAIHVLGNSAKELSHTHFLPIFFGIAVGVAIGLIPIALPGLPVPVRLGLAGGPLVAAILLSRLGRLGPVIWYMPPASNLALREMGIVLFLACVGLKSGSQFVATLMSGSGVAWLLGGICVTTIPLLIVGCVARVAFKMNYVTLSGLIAGSMTDPPALAFANTLTKSDAPSVAYASVYPLTMLLRILCAQILILLFAR